MKKDAKFGETSKKKIQLTFENVVITTIPKAKKCGNKGPPPEPKVILDDLSGSILPGQFLSIIGASGAGKTTLLNYLSGREISQNLDKKGTIKVNGVDRN
jgi:ABC-type multidrug transport system ATPase subunit